MKYTAVFRKAFKKNTSQDSKEDKFKQVILKAIIQIIVLLKKLSQICTSRLVQISVIPCSEKPDTLQSCDRMRYLNFLQ